MSNIDVSLPEPLKAYLDEQIARRGYRDASDFVRSLLEEDQYRQIRSEVEAMLGEVVDGPFSDWTDKDVDDIRRTGIAVINRRKRT